MSKFDIVVELMVKNGVTTKFSENLYENLVNNKPIIELDFSEHDKVFEDKIARLEEELKEWRAEAREIKKNRDEQLKSFRKAVEPYVDILHMHETIAELKQHIAELESKETEKPTKLNLNDRVKIKLTPLGAEIYYNRYDFLKSSIRAIGGVCTEPKMPKIDENGYTEMTMWQFIELYGKDIGKVNREVIKPLDIIIVE